MTMTVQPYVIVVPGDRHSVEEQITAHVARELAARLAAQELAEYPFIRVPRVMRLMASMLVRTDIVTAVVPTWKRHEITGAEPGWSRLPTSLQWHVIYRLRDLGWSLL